jgi:octaprenyl-diphosphate synthase
MNAPEAGIRSAIANTSVHRRNISVRLVPPARFKDVRTAPQPELDYRQVLGSVTASIQSELNEVEKWISDGLRVANPSLQPMLDHVCELGGKRLRPILTLLSAKACGNITEETIRLAAVVELLHTATLVHDDVLDGAEKRRHRPTLHNVWGVPASVLVGDWLFTHAYGLANQGESTQPGRWIASAAKMVCEGEILQGQSVGNFDISEDEYFELLKAKTGALCSVSCQLGAWSAGVPADCHEKFAEFGMTLGLAFQIYDDWLDVWGDDSVAGKTLGTDLASFKPTLPALRAIAVNPHCESDLLPRLRAQDPLASLELRNLMELSGASGYTLQKARSLASDAYNCVERVGISLDRTVVEQLGRLAVAATHRPG